MTTGAQATLADVPFQQFYGHWIAALVIGGLFGLFVWGVIRPRRHAEWRSMGISQAFIVALFAEMYGIPLTIYLLSSALGISPTTFGFWGSHLWAWLLARTGLVRLAAAVQIVAIVSNALIQIGMALLVLGWYSVYRGKGNLITGGIYRYLRHPQYLGLILLMTGFLVQWPTLPTLVMYPVLIVVYVRLAGEEDAFLAQRFGKRFYDYRRTVPAFMPFSQARSTEGYSDPQRKGRTS